MAGVALGIWIARSTPFPPNGLLGAYLLGLFLFYCWFALAAFVLIFIHECGHALAARLMGYRFIYLIVSPLKIRARVDGAGISLVRARGIRWLNGFTLGLPRDDRDLVSRQLTVLSAGPIASVLTAGLLFMLAAYLHAWWLYATFGLAALIALVNIMPLTIGANRTDGGRMLDLFKPGPRRDRIVALLRLNVLMESGARPRDCPPELVDAAASLHDGGAEEVAASLFRYMCRLDAGDAPAAGESLDRALAIVDPKKRNQTLASVERAFFTARFEHDGGAAQAMLDASARAAVHGHTRLRAQAATLLARQQSAQAREAALAARADLDRCGDELWPAWERERIDELIADSTEHEIA